MPRGSIVPLVPSIPTIWTIGNKTFSVALGQQPEQTLIPGDDSSASRFQRLSTYTALTPVFPYASDGQGGPKDLSFSPYKGTEYPEDPTAEVSDDD